MALQVLEQQVNTGLSEDNRRTSVEGLEKVLANTYALYLKTLNFHWNVTGDMFQPLHQVFEDHYTELFPAVDEIAERIRALGFKAPASFSEFREMNQITDETGHPDARQMIRQLVEGHETVVRVSREALAQADGVNDVVTVDLLTQRINYHEKTSWMLRSFLE